MRPPHDSQSVAVVIPAFNSRNWVGEAIQSAMAQAPVAEIIVVDDGSTDDTLEVVRAHSDPRVRVMTQPNAGPATARNRGWRAATSPWVAFLDADDALAPGGIEALVSAARHHPPNRIPYGSEEIYGARFADGVRHMANLATHSGSLLAHIAINYRGTIFCSLFPRACLEAIEGFDESVFYGEDLDLALRVAKKFEFIHVPMPVYRARMHDNNRHRHRPESAREVFLATIQRVLSGPGTSMIMRRRALAHWNWVFASSLRASGQRAKARAVYLESLRAWPLKLDSWRKYLTS
jgi:glycosyltransferase involved in cell wall biosynthesis